IRLILRRTQPGRKIAHPILISFDGSRRCVYGTQQRLYTAERRSECRRVLDNSTLSTCEGGNAEKESEGDQKDCPSPPPPSSRIRYFATRLRNRQLNFCKFEVTVLLLPLSRC